MSAVRSSETAIHVLPAPVLNRPNYVSHDLLELLRHSRGPSREPLERSHQCHQRLTVFGSVGECIREDARRRTGGDQIDRVPDDLADHLAVGDIEVVAHSSEDADRRRLFTHEDQGVYPAPIGAPFEGDPALPCNTPEVTNQNIACFEGLMPASHLVQDHRLQLQRRGHLASEVVAVGCPVAGNRLVTSRNRRIASFHLHMRTRLLRQGADDLYLDVRLAVLAKPLDEVGPDCDRHVHRFG